MVYDFHNFRYEQEHGPLQVLGPSVGVCNYLTLEKIYCMLIIRNNYYLTNFKKGAGDHGHPRTTPQALFIRTLWA